MRETFLAHETFRLLSCVTELKGAEQTITHPRDGEMLRWASKGNNDCLQKEVDRRLAATQSDDASVQTIPFANPPALFCVFLIPRQPVPFTRGDLMKFYMPVGQWVDMDDGSVAHHPRHNLKRYGLVAAVKLPARGQGGVWVQSWDRLTQQNEAKTRSTVATRPWSFEDEYWGSYFLFYAQIDGDTLPFELALAQLARPPPPRVPCRFERAWEKWRDEHGSGSKAAASSGQPSGNQNTSDVADDRPFYNVPALPPNDDDLSQSPPTPRQTRRD